VCCSVRRDSEDEQERTAGEGRGRRVDHEPLLNPDDGEHRTGDGQEQPNPQPGRSRAQAEAANRARLSVWLLGWLVVVFATPPAIRRTKRRSSPRSHWQER
jgi:hypothetical protein